MNSEFPKPLYWTRCTAFHPVQPLLDRIELDEQNDQLSLDAETSAVPQGQTSDIPENFVVSVEHQEARIVNESHHSSTTDLPGKSSTEK